MARRRQGDDPTTAEPDPGRFDPPTVVEDWIDPVGAAAVLLAQPWRDLARLQRRPAELAWALMLLARRRRADAAVAELGRRPLAAGRPIFIDERRFVADVELELIRSAR